MKGSLLIVILLIITTLQTYSQKFDNLSVVSKTRVDSIKTLVNPDISDSLRATLYLDIARNLYNTDSALHYCQMALDYCRPTDTLLRAMTYHVMGWRYHQKHEIYT